MHGWIMLFELFVIEGIEIIRQKSPSLVIVDVMMPRLNGFEVVTILKNNPRTINLPIVMLTVVDEVQRGYGLGVDLYLKKPVEPEQIVENVQRVLTRKKGTQTTLLLGKPGYGSPYLKKLLNARGQNIIMAENIADSALQQLPLNPRGRAKGTQSLVPPIHGVAHGFELCSRSEGCRPEHR